MTKNLTANLKTGICMRKSNGKWAGRVSELASGLFLLPLTGSMPSQIFENLARSYSIFDDPPLAVFGFVPAVINFRNPASDFQLRMPPLVETRLFSTAIYRQQYRAGYHISFSRRGN